MIQDLSKWTTEDECRAALVQWYKSQLTPAGGACPDASPYWIETLGKVPIPAPGKRAHWCGVFVLTGLHAVSLCDWPWVLGDGFIGERLGWASRVRIERGELPKPGDVKYVERAQHYGAVVGNPFRRGDVLYVPTIDGNSGAAPGVVARHSVKYRRPGVHYYKIGHVIQAALRERAELENEQEESQNAFDFTNPIGDPASD
jgi:hypothetical protein